jgi:hypothetical protein
MPRNSGTDIAGGSATEIERLHDRRTFAWSRYAWLTEPLSVRPVALWSISASPLPPLMSPRPFAHCSTAATFDAGTGLPIARVGSRVQGVNDRLRSASPS